MLKQRVITAAIAMPLLFLFLWLNGWWLGGLIIVLFLIGAYEYWRLLKAGGRDREVLWIAGGLLYTVLLLLSGVTLYLNVAEVAEADIPMLKLMASIHPILGHIMVVIIFAMIFNTAIGMSGAVCFVITLATVVTYLIISPCSLAVPMWAICVARRNSSERCLVVSSV